MAREHVEFVREEDIPWKPLVARGWPVESLTREGVWIKPLSTDRESGAFTALMRYPPGFRRRPGHYTNPEEMYILDGALSVGDERLTRGSYSFLPAREDEAERRSDGGCLALVFYDGGPATFVESDGDVGGTRERVVLDTEGMEYSDTTIPGPPPPVGLKVLRFDEESGAMTFLAAFVPMWDYPKLEYHDCVEEVFCVVGDIWLGNAGTMTAGSYFWRPPYVTHGPFYTRSGVVILGRTDGALVNHYVEDPLRTPEENQAEATGGGDGDG